MGTEKGHGASSAETPSGDIRRQESKIAWPQCNDAQPEGGSDVHRGNAFPGGAVKIRSQRGMWGRTVGAEMDDTAYERSDGAEERVAGTGKANDFASDAILLRGKGEAAKGSRL